MKFSSLTLSIPIALALLAGSASAQCLSQQFASNPVPFIGDQFGRTLASDGDTLVVGSSGIPHDGFVDVGSAFLFQRTPSGYTQVAELTPSISSNFHMFGETAAIDGDWIVVGAPDGTGANTGAAYVFNKVGTSWIAGPRLVGSECDTGDRFGFAVGVIDGPTPRVAVGAYFNGVPGGFSTGGAVYVFEYDGANWNETQVLRSADLLPGDFFGRSLAIDANRLMVGAPFNDSVANGAGSVYMFEHDGLQYNQTAQFAGSAVASFNNFGDSMSMHGDWLAVTGGAIYVFEWQGTAWVEDQTFSGSGASGLNGSDIAIENDKLVWTAASSSNGRAWFFDRSGGSWVETGMTGTVGAGDFYGRSCALQDGVALVGADSANFMGGIPGGEAYTYPLVGSDCNTNGTFDACDIFAGTSVDADLDGVPDECGGGPTNYCSSAANSSGGAAVIATSGSTSVAANNFMLSASTVPDKPGLFFYGSTPVDVPFGNGRLCVGSPLARLSVVSGQAGVAGYTYDLTAPPAQQAQITAGSTWNFQFWFRDTGVGVGFDTSDAVAVPFTP